MIKCIAKEWGAWARATVKERKRKELTCLAQVESPPSSPACMHGRMRDFLVHDKFVVHFLCFVKGEKILKEPSTLIWLADALCYINPFTKIRKKQFHPLENEGFSSFKGKKEKINSHNFSFMPHQKRFVFSFLPYPNTIKEFAFPLLSKQRKRDEWKFSSPIFLLQTCLRNDEKCTFKMAKAYYRILMTFLPLQGLESRVSWASFSVGASEPGLLRTPKENKK